jgi:hypothetical protein
MYVGSISKGEEGVKSEKNEKYHVLLPFFLGWSAEKVISEN